MTTKPDKHLIQHSPIASSSSPPMSHPMIHPLELAFTGYSGSGKTTLISKLIASLSEKYEILYYKHNAHNFEMDKKGKDTHVVKESGASTVMINDPDNLALIGERKVVPNESLDLSWGHDFALVEGGKNLIAENEGKNRIEKILVLDSQNKILDEVPAGKILDVIALVGTGEPPSHLSGLPFFHRDQVEDICVFVESYFKNKAATCLNALIMIGGRSSRMGEDKFSLPYQGEKQVTRLFGILKQFCQEVFVSCREEQGDHPDVKPFSQIHDRFLGMGPMGGILSAQTRYPDTAWLVVAVDMPYVDEQAVDFLIQNRNVFKTATCYTNHEKGWPEPLCTIYEPKSKVQLLQHLGEGKYCPRKFLSDSHIERLNPAHQKFLFNVNTPADYQHVLEGS